MKVKAWWLLAVSGLIGAFMVAGCDSETNTANEPEASISDSEALEALFLADAELEEADVWGDDEGDLQGGGSLDEPIDPIRWGRFGHRAGAEIDVTIFGDTAAIIERVQHFVGQFRILADTTGDVHTVINKPMHNGVIRKARAIRIEDTRFPRLNWRIVGTTVEVLRSADPNPHTIWPANLEVWRNSDAGAELVAEISDPLDTWFNRENLPIVYPGEELLVHVTANRDNGFGVLRPHVFRNGHGGRLPLRDDGEYPDETAGDGVYSGSFMTGDRFGVSLVGVDLIDHLTLFDSDAPYDAGGWAVPYRVALPDQD